MNRMLSLPYSARMRDPERQIEKSQHKIIAIARYELNFMATQDIENKTSEFTSRIRFTKVWTDSGRMTMSVICEEMGVRLLGQKKLIFIKVQLKKIEHGRGVKKFQYSRDMMLIIRKYGETEFWKDEKGREVHFHFTDNFSACIS